MLRQLNSGHRFGGLAGVGFATLIVLGNVVLVPAGLPTPGTAPGEAVEFFGANAGVVGAVTALAPLTWALATLFGATAVAVLWRVEPVWALVGFAGILLQNGTFAGVMALRLALSTTDDPTGTPGLWALHDALFTLNGTFLALALVGLSVAGRRAGLIRPWHGRLGLVAAGLLFASASGTAPVIDHSGPLGLLGLTGWLLWVVWIACYGVVLMRAAPVR